MEVEKQIIKTYSRRQPVTRYESRAVLVPSYSDPLHVRESRLNDKTLVVDNFDDTFDRLAGGVVLPSGENSPGEDGVADRRESDIFEVFKMPLQAKKKPRQKGKPKVAKAAVKRKKADVGSDDSGSSDQEANHKKQGDNKKSKEKVKRAAKRKKDLSPVKVAVNGEVFVGESADENVPDNIESGDKDRTETNDSFKKPKESSVAQHKISQYFQASTPRVNRVHANIDMQNISPVVMERNDEKKKQAVPELSVQGDEHGAECNQNNGTSATDNFVKPRESLKVHQLKGSNLLTSTPRVQKIRTPVNLQNLSPIVSEKEKRVISEPQEKSVAVDVNSDENGEAASHLNEHAQVPSDQVSEPVKSPTKPSEIQCDDVASDCSVQNDVEGNEEPLSSKETDVSQMNQQEPLASLVVTNENDNQDEKADEKADDSVDCTIDDQEDSVIPAADVTSNKTPTKNQSVHEVTRSFAHSPLLFDDSECVQTQTDKNNIVAENIEENMVNINFSRHVPEQIEENKKEPANLENTQNEPATNKDKNLNVSTESSFYPHDWTNDYDSTYGYDQLKNHAEKDATVNSKLDESESKSSTICKEKSNDTSAENVTEISEASNMDNTEIQSVEKQDETERTICHEDDNAMEHSKNESVGQEESHKEVDAPTIGESESESDEQEESYKEVEAPTIEGSESESDEQEESQKEVDAPTIEDRESGSEEQEESHKEVDNPTVEDSKSESYEQEESHKDVDAPTVSSDNSHDSVNAEKVSFQNSQIGMESKQSYYADDGDSLILQLDESTAQPNSQSSDDEALIVRPSKRRRTDTSEIMIFKKVEEDNEDEPNEKELFDKSDENIDESVSAPEVVDDEKPNSESAESTNDTSLEQPVRQSEKIIDNIIEKELRIVLERLNYEDYRSPILSRRKPPKKKPAKRVSRKSQDSDYVMKKTKPEKASKPKATRVTRRSVTEDKMKQLYIQYQCKEVIIYARRLEDQNVDLPSKRGLKRKSRENSISDNDLDNSLTNGGLTDFLSKLNDPMKVTTRRKTHKRYDGHLAAITEDQANQISDIEFGKKTVTWGNDKRVTFNDFREDPEDTEDMGRKSQPIFLKPGKSWARSLSIINHFHNGKNLDELAAGRENWRHSVQTVLNMQQEGRSSSQIHEETQRELRASQASSQRESKSMRKSSIASNSRFSMRIIPSGKRSTLTDELMDSQRISYVSDRSRVSRKTSLKIRRDTLIETEDDLIRSAKDIILKRCKQTDYEPFQVCFPDSYIDNCRKIGEGVYGEVFLYEDDSEKSVIKIIPIEGDQLVNCEPQKKFHEILSEIIIAEELHKLRYDGDFHTNGFVEVNRIKCVFGKYPEKLIDLWYAYDEQKKSENDCPSMFEEDQLYIILELAHGGQDLEAYQFQNASESYAIFLQTALTLAVAEQSLEFEHRDLHWGNLLISKTEDKESTYKLGSEEISLPTKGVKVAVIDFTLSRMSYQGCKIFNDLAADPTLFEAQGEYQFDIYRMMRDNVNNDWQQFNPFTNVLWMDYTLEKMITAARYKRKTTKIHKSAIEDMKALRKEIMNYSSAFDFVTNCKKVQALLDST